MNILIDGKEQNRLPVTDRGLHYGDGLFETIAVHDGIALNWFRHMQRLETGCDRLGFIAPERRLLASDFARAMDKTGKCVGKIIVTRGQGGRGYTPPGNARPTRLVLCYPWPAYPDSWQQQGINVRYCETRLGLNAGLAGIKHLNRLEQVLARRELENSDAVEGVMLDSEDNVIECTSSNLFLIDNDTLVTPSLDRAGVAGITRQRIIELAGSNAIAVRVGQVDRAMLERADACFVCNAIAGIWPVRQLQQRTFAPHPLIARLQHLLADSNKQQA